MYGSIAARSLRGERAARLPDPAARAAARLDRLFAGPSTGPGAPAAALIGLVVGCLPAARRQAALGPARIARGSPEPARRSDPALPDIAPLAGRAVDEDAHDH